MGRLGGSGPGREASAALSCPSQVNAPLPYNTTYTTNTRRPRLDWLSTQTMGAFSQRRPRFTHAALSMCVNAHEGVGARRRPAVPQSHGPVLGVGVPEACEREKERERERATVSGCLRLPATHLGACRRRRVRFRATRGRLWHRCVSRFLFFPLVSSSLSCVCFFSDSPPAGELTDRPPARPSLGPPLNTAVLLICWPCPGLQHTPPPWFYCILPHIHTLL